MPAACAADLREELLARVWGPTGVNPAPARAAHGPLGAVNLTMPLATWLGLSDAPGHAAGYGPLDAGDSRDLAARLAGQRGGRWCITLTGEGGRPVAYGCARTGPGPSGRSRPPPRRPPRSGSPGLTARGGSPRRAATSPRLAGRRQRMADRHR